MSDQPGGYLSRKALDAALDELWGPTDPALDGAVELDPLAVLLDVQPVDVLAAILRRHLAAGLPLHPSIIQTMDNLLPGWQGN